MLDHVYIPKINYASSSMIDEIVDIKFLSTEQIKGISPDNKFMDLVRKMIKIVKNVSK